MVTSIPAPLLESARLRMRHLAPHDRTFVSRLVTDPKVQEFFPCCYQESEIEDLFQRMLAAEDSEGIGFWVVEDKNSAEPMGLISLLPIAFDWPWKEALEIGFRFLPYFQRLGLAQESLVCFLRWQLAFSGRNQLVAYTAENNVRSCRLLERCGFVQEPAFSFSQPDFPADHPSCRHCLYRFKLQIRLPTSPEIPSIQRLECAAALRFQQLGMEEIAPGESLSADRLHAALQNQQILVVESVYAHKLCAFVVWRIQERWLFVEEIDSAPEWSGWRLGALLLSQLVQQVREQQLAGIALTTFESVPWNRPYYLRLGFQDVTERPPHPWFAEKLSQEFQQFHDKRCLLVFPHALD